MCLTWFFPVTSPFLFGRTKGPGATHPLRAPVSSEAREAQVSGLKILACSSKAVAAESLTEACSWGLPNLKAETTG